MRALHPRRGHCAGGGELVAAAERAAGGRRNAGDDPLVARKGRASYLGDRSSGHQDPGATSSALMMRAAARATAGQTEDSTVPKYAAALDQGTTSTRAMIFDHAGQVVSVSQKEHEQIFRSRAGSSTARWRSGRDRRRSSTRPSTPRARPPTTSPDSASPTSARPRWSGTRRPVSRSTTRSSGRTRGPTSSSTSSPPTAARTVQGADGPAAGHLLLGPQGPVDPRQRRRRAREGRVRVTCCSATWTPGSSGT